MASNLDGLLVSSNPRFYPSFRDLRSAADMVDICHGNFIVKHGRRLCQGQLAAQESNVIQEPSFSECTLGGISQAAMGG